MLFPSFLPAGGLKYANMATFQAFTPRSAPCGKDEESPHVALWGTTTSVRNHPSDFFFFFSDKLVYAAVWMRNSKYFWARGSRKKAKEEVISERREGGSHMMEKKKMGTGLRSGTARFLMGSLPSAPWEVRSSALQSHQGHHLLQLEGQPLFPGSIILLQCTHDLPQHGKHT